MKETTKEIKEQIKSAKEDNKKVENNDDLSDYDLGYNEGWVAGMENAYSLFNEAIKTGKGENN